MDRCSGCGGAVTTGGCMNPSCMQSLSGYYVGGKKVAPLTAQPPVVDIRTGIAVSAQLERARIVARLRARATAEQVTADRWVERKDDRMATIHTKAAEVLREECDRLESGL